MKIFIYILTIATIAGCKSLKQDRPIHANVKTTKLPKIKLNKGPIKPLTSLSQFNGDTLKYIQTNFLNRQEAYINKPFKVFLADLGIPVQGFLPGISPQKMKLVPNITIRIYSDREIFDKKRKQENPVQLVITWAVPLEDIYPIVLKSHGIWTEEVQQYFADKIIARIDIVKYNF